MLAVIALRLVEVSDFPGSQMGGTRDTQHGWENLRFFQS